MQLSAKTEYACIAAVELAMRYRDDEPVRIGSIAEAYGIPARSLVPILLQLKGAGLVASTRGSAGGYRLNRDPAEITLAAVMGVFEDIAGDINTSAGRGSAASECLCSVWKSAAAAHREALDSVTLAELAEQSRGAADPMYYI